MGQLIFAIVMLVIPFGFVAYTAYSYLTVPNPEMNIAQKLAYSTKRSMTLFVQFAAMASLALANGVLDMSDFFGAPELKSYVTQNLSPGMASSVMLGLMFVTCWARMRSGSTQPTA